MVHIDETPITRRHGNRRNRSRSNTVWIIGAVDILNKKAVLKFLPSRGHVNVIPFIQDFVARNSCIHTDSLATYRILTELGFDHNMVNHSIELVSKEGVHTNHIEGIFGNMKRLKRHYSYQFTDTENLNILMAEWVFRFCYSGWNRREIFGKIIKIMSLIRLI